jgi:hypothetical protein
MLPLSDPASAGIEPLFDIGASRSAVRPLAAAAQQHGRIRVADARDRRDVRPWLRDRAKRCIAVGEMCGAV